MSRWRRSVDELTAGRRRQQAECERAQNALSRVTSCFQQLAASLGSSADSSFLREEMDETRALAHRICSGNTCPAGLTCPVCVLLGSPVPLQVCLAACCACCQPVTPPPLPWTTDMLQSNSGFSSCLQWSTSCLTSGGPKS